MTEVPGSDLAQWLLTLPLRVARTVRVVQWWDYKLVPAVSVFYATALAQQISVASIWPGAIALLIAIAACATYVSVINDLTDRADDQGAGKANRMSGRPAWQIGVLLGVPLVAALFFCVLWRDDPSATAAYLGSWAAFSLYSIPPFRLKIRGALGLIADACGSHVFPTLTAVFLVRRATGNPADPLWTAALLAWALGYGVRGILWHQLYDFTADQQTGVQTFVQKHSRQQAVRLARAAFAAECAGLAAVLWLVSTPWPAVFMLMYAAFAALKRQVLNIDLIIADPTERYSIVGQEYYTLFLPAALLFSSALKHPLDSLVLAGHLILFPQPLFSFANVLQLLLQKSRAQLRR